MKNVFKYIVLLFGVAAFAASCSDDQNVEYAWPEEESGLKLWFAEDAATSYELAENQSSVSFYIYRNQTATEQTVEIDAACVTEDAYTFDAEGNPVSCLFDVPTTATFAAGSDVAQVRVLLAYSEIEAEKQYEFEVAVKDPANYSTYGANSLNFTVAAYPDWEAAGWGTFDNPVMGLFGWPTFVSYIPIQHKAGTNLYRLPRYNAYWMESNKDALIADGTFADEAAFNEELEWQYSNCANIVFQINDSNKSDGVGKEWDFYNMATGVQDDPASFLYGNMIQDKFHGHAYLFATKNYQAGYRNYCKFWNDSSIDRKYNITQIFVYQGSPYNWSDFVFDWVENPAVGDSWQISTNYNADFSYADGGVVTFTPEGFPELGSYEVVFQESADKEGLFRLKDAFGVEGYGLSFFVNDNKVTVPADQPTGRMQNGMMVYVGPSGASEIDKDGNLQLGLEYYMIEEKVTMPAPEADKLPTPSGSNAVEDPNDPRFEWPSGTVGVGERYEKTEPAPEAPAQDPKPIVTTRRISLGTFENHATTSGYAYASIDDYVGEFVITGTNFGPYYLGNYASYYPAVGQTVTVKVKVEKGEKDAELKISGLFSNVPNGDTSFTPGSVKDTVVGTYNKIGGYVLIPGQATGTTVTVLGNPETGKPDREYPVYFTGFDVDARDVSDAPVAMYRIPAGIQIANASMETQTVAAYTFYSDYDDGCFLNFDIPYVAKSIAE
ncbi:MAG: hypothetical protein J6L75_03415 [Alistipes sp.]|nr:hypothetical protein [Alistipes sp.]